MRILTQLQLVGVGVDFVFPLEEGREEGRKEGRKDRLTDRTRGESAAAWIPADGRM